MSNDIASKHCLLDMNRVISECRRVLTKNGQAVFVIGDSNIGGVFVKNSEGLISLATRNGFALSGRVAKFDEIVIGKKSVTNP